MDERLLVSLLCAAVGLLAATIFVARRKVAAAAVSLPPGALWEQPQADPLAPYVPPAPPAPVIGEDDTIRALSSRLASLEGSMPNLRQQVDSIHALTGRVSNLETEIPGLADAWERFSDSMDRKDKRDGERDRRGKKKETVTAAEAAQDFLGPLGSGTAVPGVTAPGAAPKNGKRRGIVGGGGRGRGA